MAKIKLFDRVMKILGRHYASSFLKLAFPDQPIQLIGTLENVELSLPDERIDFIHRIRVGRKEYLLHFEFQLRHQKNVPRRVFIYSGEVTDGFQTPVISIVLYLERRKSPIPHAYEVKIGRAVIHQFTYPILKLWDYEERIRSGELLEFAPLLVMLAQEKTMDVLQTERELILREKDSQKRSDLLATAVMLASRYFDMNFLWDFFREEVEQMHQSNFIQDWIQQAEKQARQQGRQEGLQQGAQQRAQAILIRQLKAKLGRLPRAAEREIRAMTNEDELDRLSLLVLTANSIDEMGLNGVGRRSE